MAYEIIIKQNCNTLPLDPLTFKIDNVILMSFQEYSEKTGISVDTLTRNGKLKDGYTMSKDGLSVIFYDAATYEPRQRFTRFHEIGHVVLNHNQQCEKNESEANFFAAQCILPNALLKEIKARGYTITKDLLVQTFNVSDQVALYRLDYLKDYPDLHKNEYDDIIVELFKSYLDSHFPSKRTRDNYDFLEEQEKRNDW